MKKNVDKIGMSSLMGKKYMYDIRQAQSTIRQGIGESESLTSLENWYKCSQSLPAVLKTKQGV